MARMVMSPRRPLPRRRIIRQLSADSSDVNGALSGRRRCVVVAINEAVAEQMSTEIVANVGEDVS